MASVLVGILMGFAVCLFGMWAFLKGQQSMAQIQAAGSPKNLAGPLTLLRQRRREEETKRELQKQDDYTNQLRALLGGAGGQKK